jgi:Domain of unknown function (DUF4129)
VREDPNVAIRAILARPEFAHMRSHGDAGPTPWERLVSWLFGLLRRLFAHVHADPHLTAVINATGWLASTILFAVVVGLALAGVALVLYRIVVALARRSAHGGGWVAMETGLSRAQSAADLRAAAFAAAQRGEYALAVALVFRAALVALDEQALIVYDGARTPGEYRRLVRRTVAGAAGAFDDLTVLFVRASYARGATSRADFDGASGAFDAFAANVR